MKNKKLQDLLKSTVVAGTLLGVGITGLDVTPGSWHAQAKTKAKATPTPEAQGNTEMGAQNQCSGNGCGKKDGSAEEDKNGEAAGEVGSEGGCGAGECGSAD